MKSSSSRPMISAIVGALFLFAALIVFLLASQKPVHFTPRAAPSKMLLADDFEQGLSNWSIDKGVDTELDTTDPVRKHLLRITYPAGNAHILVKRTIDPRIALRPNLVYEIEFYDDPGRDYGVGAYVIDANGNYIMVGVNDAYFGSHYFLRNGPTAFDSNISRTKGWHTFQFYVTKVGAYPAIDGQSLVYLRSKITDPANEKVSDFPINTAFKQVKEFAIEYPSWEKNPSLSYWDNLKVYPFRDADEPTAKKEEDVLIDFLNGYENEIRASQDAYNQAIISLKGVQNFQLSRAGLAAAYGVRARRNNSTADWQMLEKILTQIVDDYQSGWSKQAYESPIAAQAVATIASWRWQYLPQPLKDKIASLVENEALRVISQINPAEPNAPGDSKAEEKAWFSSLLGFAADFLSQNGYSGFWAVKAKQFACNATSSPTTRSKYACEQTVALTNDFLVINHNLVHPGYTLTVPWGFAQATLFKLNRNALIPLEYTKNIRDLYTSFISLIRLDTYTYKDYYPKDNTADRIFAYTARDDWGQDATLQDQGWAYMDKVLGLNNIAKVVDYAWLTRAGGTLFPTGGLAQLKNWISLGSVDCGGQQCAGYQPSPALYYFLNSMDAIDRFMTLFIVDPTNYRLTSVQ